MTMADKVLRKATLGEAIIEFEDGSMLTLTKKYKVRKVK